MSCIKTFLIILCLFSSCLFSTQEQVTNKKHRVNGQAVFNTAHFTSLEVNGSLTFDHLSVDEDIIINGSTKGDYLTCGQLRTNGQSTLNNVTIKSLKSNGACSLHHACIDNDISAHGSLNLEKVTVAGTIKIHGKLFAQESSVKNIEIHAQRAYLSSTKVSGSILVKELTSESSFWDFFGFTQKKRKNTQILEVKNGSCITENIIFEYPGEIHLYDTSEIKGTVTQAKIIRK